MILSGFAFGHETLDVWMVSGTKTDDLDSPCLSTCWSWRHVHQWLDFDSSTSDSDSADTNLGLNVSDVCMNVYDLDSIKHIISITFDLLLRTWTVAARARLTNSDRSSHVGTEMVYKTLLQWSTLLTSGYEGVLMTALLGFMSWAKTTF